MCNILTYVVDNLSIKVEDNNFKSMSDIIIQIRIETFLAMTNEIEASHCSTN
jgi:hypothetical protein